MTTFTFYKLEGRESYMLNVAAEEKDNLGQSSEDKEVNGHIGQSSPTTDCNSEVFNYIMASYTDRIVHEARLCWQKMSCRQRARFGPVRNDRELSLG